MSLTTTATGFVLVLSGAVSVPALAQQPHAGHANSSTTTAPSAASAPLKPAAKAAQERSVIYRSAFDGYRGFTDEKSVPWREANETVGRIGGWRAYAKEAQQPAKPDATASQPGATTAPASSGGHGAHKQP